MNELYRLARKVKIILAPGWTWRYYQGIGYIPENRVRQKGRNAPRKP